eukprot:11279-Pelagococcus_subviridis.AAC.4
MSRRASRPALRRADATDGVTSEASRTVGVRRESIRPPRDEMRSRPLINPTPAAARSSPRASPRRRATRTSSRRTRRTTA